MSVITDGGRTFYVVSGVTYTTLADALEAMQP